MMQLEIKRRDELDGKYRRADDRGARQHTFPLKFQGKPIEVRVSEKSHKWIIRQGIFT